MTSAEKVKEAERRILAVVHGNQDFIDCPFCGGHSEPPQPLCCELLATMVDAIIDRQQTGEAVNMVDRVMDRMAGNCFDVTKKVSLN